MFRITNENLKPRKYQLDALEKAKKGNAVICLPTGTGKTLVGLMWACHLLNERKAKRILVLEPSRFLVNQISDYYAKNSNIKVEKLYGTTPKEERVKLWDKGDVVVTTPQTAFNDINWLNFDAVIVDECHHTTGEHAYAKLMQSYNFKYKLGLSATIPAGKEEEIKRHIGEIYRWSWNHPDVKDYVPEWYAEVYDAEFDENHRKVYEKLRRIRYELEGTPFAGLCSLAMRMLCRDGALALKETLEKENTMSALLRGEVYEDLVKCDVHKLGEMRKVIEQHDFGKAIVFVDRVVLARKIYKEFEELNPVLLLGRVHSSEEAQMRAVREAASEDVKLVVSTSAGEEGIDLPSADLLIVWSNVVSAVRFIQRTGRIMRKTKQSLKIAAYIATPETEDYDALWRGMVAARNAGVEIPGIDVEALSKGTVVESIISFLQLNPTSITTISEALQIPVKKLNSWLREAINRGKVFYFYLFPYDPMRMAVALRRYKNREYDEYLLPHLKRYFKSFGSSIADIRRHVESGYASYKHMKFFANFVINRFTENDRIYALSEDVALILSDYSDYFKVPAHFKFELNYGFSHKKRSEYTVYGTSDEIFEQIKGHVVGKRVYLYFSSWGVYTGANVRYNGCYTEETLELVVRNAGWICWNVKKMNEIIGS